MLIILARPDTARLGAIVAAALLAGYVLMPESIRGESQRGIVGFGTTVESPDRPFR